MQKLAKREAQLMAAVWKLEKAFIRDIMELLPDNPHYNTVSTMVKILETKGFLAREEIGNALRFYPIISEAEYQAEHQDEAINEVMKNFFDNSPLKLVSYFAKEKKLNAEELEEILRMIKDGKS